MGDNKFLVSGNTNLLLELCVSYSASLFLLFLYPMVCHIEVCLQVCWHNSKT